MAYPKVDESVWPEFLERISNGEAVRVICKDKSMPSWATVARKIAAEPDFEKQYRMALEFRGMMLAEELDEIYRDTRAGMIVERLGATSTRPIVVTAGGPMRLASPITPVAISAKASMGSCRKCMGKAPA